MANEKENKESAPQTSGNGLGLEQNVSALLAYLFGWVGGLLFILTEKDNKFVRFAAAQSIVFNVSIFAVYVVYWILSSVLTAILGFLGAIMFLVTPLISIGIIVVWVMLMIKAYNNQEWELPIIGKIARSIVK